MADIQKQAPATIDQSLRKAIADAMQTVKDRPASRRGPYVISDEDLNNAFSIKD